MNKEFSHYYKDVSKLEYIDIYRVLSLYEVEDPCIQHAIKKLLVAGNRGLKNIEKDVREAIISMERWEEMQSEQKNNSYNKNTLDLSHGESKFNFSDINYNVGYNVGYDVGYSIPPNHKDVKASKICDKVTSISEINDVNKINIKDIYDINSFDYGVDNKYKKVYNNDIKLTDSSHNLMANNNNLMTNTIYSTWNPSYVGLNDSTITFNIDNMNSTSPDTLTFNTSSKSNEKKDKHVSTFYHYDV